MGIYRMLFEPEYGEKLPDVIMPEPEKIDLEHPKLWRESHTPITVNNIRKAISNASCYEKLMEASVIDFKMDREGCEIPIRVYRPEGEAVCPIVVFYHGGAFMMNNFDVYEYVTRYIASYAKAAVVSVAYRLAPEYKCPVGREDAYSALEWAKEHADEYGGDADNISVCGDSAGGNFAAAVSIMARDRKGPGIRRQIMIYPLVIFKPPERDRSELRYGTGYFLEYDSQKEPLCAYFGEDNKEMIKEPYNSPLLCDDLSGLPDAYIYAAECDPLFDQGQMYAAKLMDAGVSVSYAMYKGMIHSFLNYAYKETFECLDEICRAINEIK